ncbi:MAG: response regulator transcription factor [Bdellovibrionales bacterium]|jgi:DNA-binding response OmpR family regulator|nr:response regulator transcription factor [Bdellovibrionales bacterium]
MKSLLLVEDDRSLAETLSERLTKEGYQVTWADCAATARAEIGSRRFDLLILDVGLPDGNGFALAKEVKAYPQNAETPFLFLTAMNSAEYRLEGYELGAEEYIPKPFHLRELLLRVKHVLENHSSPDVLTLSDRVIYWGALEIRSAGSGPGVVLERLQPRDAMLLKLLIARSPVVVSRDEILNQIWGEESFPSSRTVDNAIVRLRQALGDEHSARIRSVRGVGYQWE